jgi:branched-chain amino acid transport system permease protein
MTSGNSLSNVQAAAEPPDAAAKPRWAMLCSLIRFAAYPTALAGGAMLVALRDPYLVQIALGVLVSAILALSWDLTHRVGQLSMAQGGMFGTGGYAVAVLAPMVGTLGAWVAAIAVCLLFSLFIGGVTLRLKGFYFNLATLAFTVSMQVVVVMWDDLTGGSAGIGPPVLAGGDAVGQLWALIGMLLLSMAISDYFLSAKIRPALLMIRSHPDVAAASGVPVTQTKMLVFAVSSGIAGLAGAAYATLYGFIVPADMYNLNWCIVPIAAVLLGGGDSTIGALLGGGLIRLLEEGAKITIGGVGYQVVYGLVIILFVLVFPGGIVAAFRRR